MIIRGGENISSREIEDFIYHMPGVKDAQVVAIASPKYGEDVGVFIIPHEGAELVEEDVKEFCKDKIARYKIPRYVFFVNEYPLTGSGKIQKFKLREMALELCKERGISII
jgi:fatty-acyl-CoA synthase